MSIICGTDFSPGAVQAGRAAAALSARLDVPLRLIHVIDELGAELSVGSEHDALFDPLRRQLRQQAEALRREYTADVETTIVPGFADRKVVSTAERLSAELVVVSSEGGEKQNRWLLGSVASRIAQSSPAPVMVVHEASSIEAWAGGSSELSVVVGLAPEAGSLAALRWAVGLRQIGPCDLKVVEVSAPAAKLWDSSANARRERELSAWLDEQPGRGSTSFFVRVSEEPTEAALNAVAVEYSANLLVIGAHQRKSLARLWHRSVSRAVLKHATLNVACVPCHE